MAEFLKKASGSLQTMPEFITVFILYKRRITSKQMHHKSYQTEEKSHQMPKNSVEMSGIPIEGVGFVINNAIIHYYVQFYTNGA